MGLEGEGQNMFTGFSHGRGACRGAFTLDLQRCRSGWRLPTVCIPSSVDFSAAYSVSKQRLLASTMSRKQQNRMRASFMHKFKFGGCRSLSSTRTWSCLGCARNKVEDAMISCWLAMCANVEFLQVPQVLPRRRLRLRRELDEHQ